MDSDGTECYVRSTKLGACTVGEVKPQLTLSANGTTPRTLLCNQADSNLRKAITSSGNVWRDHNAEPKAQWCRTRY
jgi:hypothetical protein